MIYKLKYNTKIKLISLLSAIVLWLYVMAVVDPEETKLIENIPVTIDNMSDLTQKDLIIYPEEELNADIYISGKLSDIQKVKKDGIHVHGKINNPIEGNNELALRATISSQRVSHEFKTGIIVVNLEKVVSEEKPVHAVIEGNSKNNIDNISLSSENVKVSGPRSLVNQVQEVIGTLSIDNETNDFFKNIELTPVDKKGKLVDGVNLETLNIDVMVTLMQEKYVPIKVVIKDGYLEDNIKNYTLSQESLKIKGKKEIIDKIESINTQSIDLSDMPSDSSKKVYLDIPNGISTDTESIILKLNELKRLTSEFIYTSDEIEIRNNKNEIDMSTINIPQNIKVLVEYTNEISNLTKSDISLYIDLTNKDNEIIQFKIMYDTKYNIENITISPDTVEINT